MPRKQYEDLGLSDAAKATVDTVQKMLVYAKKIVTNIENLHKISNHKVVGATIVFRFNGPTGDLAISNPDQAALKGFSNEPHSSNLLQQKKQVAMEYLVEQNVALREEISKLAKTL